MTHLTSKPDLNRVEWVALGVASVYYALRRAVVYGGFAGYAYLYNRWSGIAERTGQSYEAVADAEIHAFSEWLATWVTSHGRLGMYAFFGLVFAWTFVQIMGRFNHLEDAVIRFWEARMRAKAVTLALLGIGLWVQFNRELVTARLTEVWPL